GRLSGRFFRPAPSGSSRFGRLTRPGSVRSGGRILMRAALPGSARPKGLAPPSRNCASVVAVKPTSEMIAVAASISRRNNQRRWSSMVAIHFTDAILAARQHDFDHVLVRENRREAPLLFGDRSIIREADTVETARQRAVDDPQMVVLQQGGDRRCGR